MSRLYRLLFAIGAFVLSLTLALRYHLNVPGAGNDFYFPICAAMALLRGIDPYGGACPIVTDDAIYAPNPLTTALVALPFAPLGWHAGGLFLWSAITALLVYALAGGPRWRLALFFTSAAYWQAFRFLQWSPLLAAVMLLPSLLPLALVKPHIGLPVILSHLTRRRVFACALFGLLTLALDPTWPLRWMAQTGTYDGFIPALLLPFGPLLLLSALRWRDPDARFLLLMALVPQRGIYDLSALWLVARTPRQMLMLSASSWLGIAVEWFSGSTLYPAAAVVFVYLPALALVLHGVTLPAYVRAGGLRQWASR